MSGSNSTFAWVFPPAPRLNAHTSNNSEAKNLTHAYHVYGSFPIYKEDAIQLEFNTSSPHAEVDIAYECEYNSIGYFPIDVNLMSNGTRLENAQTRILRATTNTTFVMQFIASPRPMYSLDTCLFSYTDPASKAVYYSVAFGIFNITQADGYSRLYSADNPRGVFYRNLRKGEEDSALRRTRLRVGLGVGLGLLALMVVVVGLVVLYHRKKRGARAKEEDSDDEVEMDNVWLGPPPTYDQVGRGPGGPWNGVNR